MAVILAFIVMDIGMLGTRPVLSPDEARYGSIAAQMVESGDWLHLRMSGFHFYEKPALNYWMTASSISVFGHNAFAIRLPAALCTGFGALALAMAMHRGARLLGRRPDVAATAGALGALVSLTMFLPAIGAGLQTLDAPIAAFVTGSCALFFMAATEPPYKHRARVGWLVASGVCAGLGFMTKGLPAIAFPALAIVPWLVWERRWRDLFILPWIPLIVAGVVVAPWGITMALMEPGFWERFIIHEHFGRFMGGQANQPSESPAFYLLVVPLGMIPWLAVAPTAARWLPGLLRSDSGARFALCWAVGPLLLLSASSGKLPTYALPVFPPLAWLITIGLLKHFETQLMRTSGIAPRVVGAILMFLGGAALVIGAGGSWTQPWIAAVWTEGAHARAALLGVVFIVWGAGDWWANASRVGPERIMRLGLAPVAAIACFGLLFPDTIIDDYKAPGRSIMANREEMLAAPTLIVDPKMGHACAWFLGRHDFLIYGAPEEFDNGLKIEANDNRLVHKDALAERVASSTLRGAVAVAVPTGAAQRILGIPQLATPTRQIHSRGWSLLIYQP